MAPLYTAKKLLNRSIQSPDFNQRDIDGLTTGRLEELHFVGRPHVIQPHYPQYVGNISAFLTATAMQRKVLCGQTYWPQMDPALLLPIRLPPLTLSPVRPFTKDEDKARYLARLPQNTATTVYLKRECYVVLDPLPSSIGALPPTDPNVPATSDSVSLNGMRQFLTTLKIVSLFLATHTYPAFQTENDDGEKNSEDIDIIHPDGGAQAIKGYRGSESTYKARTRAVGWVLGDPVMQEGTPAVSSESTYTAHGSVIVAKPAPLYPTVNYGPPSRVPNLPGFVFPYFRGEIFPAEGSTISIMRRFFLACFGDSPDSGTSRWSTWRSSVTKWHKTDAGMALSHILFCLQTTLECQGRMFVVLQGSTYLGCAVLGFKFSIDVDGQLRNADTATEVRHLVTSLDEHEKAVDKIIKMLQGMALLGETDVDMDVEVDVSTPRNLYRELSIREPPNTENKGKLLDLVSKLAFHQRYWAISGDTVAKAIDLIISSDEVPGDLPMYVDPKCVLDDASRIYEVLSVFGPTAPSMVDSQGRTVSIPRGLEAADPASEVPSGHTGILMPKLFLTPKPLHVSVNDWRGVLRNRRIKQNETERAGGFRTISIAGRSRDRVWAALKKIPWEDSNGKGKGKRSAEDEGDREASAKKPREEPKDESLGDF